MGLKTILFSFFIMAFTVSTYAQKAKGKALQWKIAAELPALAGQTRSLGVAGPVAGVHNNYLIVGGGANFPDSMPWQGGKKKYYDEAFVYKKGRKNMALHKISRLPSTIAYAAVCSTPKGIVYAGGENEKGISKDVVLLQWDKMNDTLIAKDLPTLPVALTNASAVFHQNIIYLAGGETTNFGSDGFFSLDLNQTGGGWRQLPVIPRPVSHAVLAIVEDNGRSYLYLIGGRKKNRNGISDLYSSVFCFDILENQWKEKASLPYALSAGTGIGGDQRVYLFGGDRGETFHKVETMIAAINAEKNELKKKELILQKNKLQSSHPGFSKEVLSYNAASDSWTVAGCIPFDSPVTTIAVKWDGQVIIPNGEIKAGVRTPNLLMGKFK